MVPKSLEPYVIGKRMGMALGLEKGHCSAQDLTKAIKMDPKSLVPYVIGNTLWPDSKQYCLMDYIKLCCVKCEA